MVDSLEKLVRFRLAQREQERAQEYINKHPEAKTEFDNALVKFEEITKKTMDEFPKTLARIAEEHGEKVEQSDMDGLVFPDELKFIVNMVGGLVKTQFSLEQYIADSGKAYYKIAEEPATGKPVRVKFKHGDVDFSNLSELADLKGAHYSRMRDVMVARLMDVAKEKGIEVAMQDKVVYSVIRELFPTKEKYLQSISGYDAVKPLLNKLGPSFGEMFGKMTTMDSKDGAVTEMAVSSFSALFSSIIGGLNVYLDASTKIEREIEKENAAKIYSTKKAMYSTRKATYSTKKS